MNTERFANNAKQPDTPSRGVEAKNIPTSSHRRRKGLDVRCLYAMENGPWSKKEKKVSKRNGDRARFREETVRGGVENASRKAEEESRTQQGVTTKNSRPVMECGIVA